MKKNLLLLLAAMAVGLVAGAQGISLPWSEDFESYSTGGNSKPTGWTRVDSLASGSAVYPNIYSYGSTHGKVLNFNGSGVSSNGVMRIATPRILAPLNQLELSFTVYKSTLYLYIATDPANQSTYHLVGSYAPGWVWTTYEVRTDTLTGATADTGYLVFAGNFGSNYGNAYLDDLTVMPLNSCERPSTVTVDQVTPTTATLSWPAVAGALGYIVSYDTVNDQTNATTEVCSSTDITLTDLEADKTYYVWVQTDCANGVSESRTATFTTELRCYAITGLAQVTSGYDAASFQWSYENHGFEPTGVLTVLHDLTDSTVDDVVETSMGTNSHIFINLDNTHQYQVTLYTLCDEDTAEGVSANIVFRNCGESELYSHANDHSADYPFASAYGSSYCQVLYNGDVAYSIDTIRGVALHRFLNGTATPTTRTLNIYMGHTTLDSLTSNQGTSGLTLVANSVSYSLPLQEWDTLLFTTPFVYDGHSNILFTVQDVTGTGLSLSSAAQWYWHASESKMYFSYGTSAMTVAYKQPDLRFVGNCNDELQCDPPAVMVGEVDSASASITWYGAAGSYHVVQYRPQGGSTWIVVDTVADMNYTLQGLTPSTHYEVRVGVICDVDVVRYSVPAPFTTSCALIHVPFHFTQDNMVAASTNGFTDCWSFSQYIYRGRLTDSHRGYLRNAGEGEWIMLPAIAEPLQGARLRTWIGSSDAGFVRVGVASQSNCSDVEWIDTIVVPAGNPNTSHDEYIVYFDTYEGFGNRIVLSPIVNNNYHYIYFFDFHVEPVEGCRPPVRMTFDESDSSSITFHWTAVGGATSWVVTVDGVEAATVNVPSCTVTGLDAYTEYEIGVRSLCDDGDTSAAATATFATGCAGDECWVTVVGHSSSGDGWRGAHLHASANGQQVCDFTLRRGSVDSVTIRFCADMHVSFDWLSGNDDAVCSFEILGAMGDTLYISNAIDTLGADFFVSDSICGDTTSTPEPGPGPGSVTTVEATTISLLPNPASTVVAIEGIRAGATVTIVDCSGRQVYRRDNVAESLAVDVKGFATGVYFVRVTGDNINAVGKLIVE